MPLNISVQSQKRCQPGYNHKPLHLEEYKYFMARAHHLRASPVFPADSSSVPSTHVSLVPSFHVRRLTTVRNSSSRGSDTSSGLASEGACVHMCGPLPKLKIKIMRTFNNCSHARGPLTYEGHLGTSGGIWVGSRKQRWCNRSSWTTGRAGQGHRAALPTLLVNSKLK